jgi:hypothetical protein
MLIQLPDFRVPHLEYELLVDRWTDPLVITAYSPPFSTAEALFRGGLSMSVTYVDGQVRLFIARATMYYLGNGFHPFEIRLVLANGHVLTPVTGRLSVYLL